MSKDRVNIQRRGLYYILHSLFFCSSIDMQPLQPWAVRVERIPVSFYFDGYTDFQHFSQFHVAPRML